MVRIRALVVSLLAGVMVIGIGGSAFGDAPADRPASFCSTARRVGDKFSQLDPSALDDENAIADIENAAKKLARQAPQSLKKPFRTLIAFYDEIAAGGLDLSDTEAIEDLARRSERVSRAANKIIGHLVEKCDLSLE